MRRRPERWGTKLGSWISDFTVKRLAAELAARGDPVRVGTIYQWIEARTTPRPQRAMAMIEIANGAITMTDVYGHRAQVGGGRT